MVKREGQELTSLTVCCVSGKTRVVSVSGVIEHKHGSLDSVRILRLKTTWLTLRSKRRPLCLSSMYDIPCFDAKLVTYVYTRLLRVLLHELCFTILLAAVANETCCFATSCP